MTGGARSSRSGKNAADYETGNRNWVMNWKGTEKRWMFWAGKSMPVWLRKRVCTCQMMKDLPIARESCRSSSPFIMDVAHIPMRQLIYLNRLVRKRKKKVQDLFGPGSAVSKYFARITDNLYTEVSLNREKGMVEVLRSDGRKLDAWQLSGGGAYDQLYLCIRISLGEKLLQGEKGFFILDDPFLKSDTRRLMNQIEFYVIWPVTAGR